MIVFGLLAGTGLYQQSHAQVNVTVNIGSQPLWGPTGYDYVNYYYLPDLDIYSMFRFSSGFTLMEADGLLPRHCRPDTASMIYIGYTKL